MDTILQDTSTASLIKAILENSLGFLPVFRKWQRAEVHDEAEIKWTLTDLPIPLFNNVFYTRLTPERTDATIQSLIAKARSRNVPLRWLISPITRPADLGERLEKHGFTNTAQVPGMAAILSNLNENLPMPEGFTMKRVTDDETLKQWSRVLARGFEMPDSSVEIIYDFLHHADKDAMPIYLGLQNGQPVATSQIILEAGVAGVYSVATIPEKRRQGIGGMITLLPLLEARDRGYRVGILHASQMGVGVYRSLGFREYCQIRYYRWSPDGE